MKTESVVEMKSRFAALYLVNPVVAVSQYMAHSGLGSQYGPQVGHDKADDILWTWADELKTYGRILLPWER